MNSLQDQIATLNSVQYSRYRLAFKLRRLQSIFLLDHVEVAGVQDVLHSAGVQGLRLGDEVPLTQLHSALTELYRNVRTQQPLIPANQLQNAQECCYDWLQLAYDCSSSKPMLAGEMKLMLCLFCGSKPGDKARYLFNLLANSNGAIEREGVRYFCRVTQQLAKCLGEKLYAGYHSLDELFRECLVFVRSAEDVEDEELDGGIKRQLLSQFEFGKIFAASSAPPFLAWLALWRQLPSLERVVHPVKCSVCTRKPIVSIRYQCTQCPNFHMCQMCFLKGRVAGRHALSHSVVEFTSAMKGGKSWHHRLLGLPAKPQGGRPFQEPRDPFMPASSSNVDEVDSLFLPPRGTPGGSVESSPVSHRKVDHHTFQPAVIRIGSGDSLQGDVTVKRLSSASPKKEASPRREPLPPHGPARTLSYTSGSSSPSSLSSGSKFSYDGPLSSAGYEHNASSVVTRNHVSSELQPGASETTAPSGRGAVPMRLRPSASDSVVLDQKDSESQKLKEINKRLSVEVDQLLLDLPPAAAISPRKRSPTPSSLTRGFQASPPLVADVNLSGSLHKLAGEERALQSQVNQLTDKREKLAHELQDLLSQVQQMHYGFVNLSNGVRAPSTSSLSNGMEAPIAPMHLRYPSAPVATTTDPSVSLPTIRVLREPDRGLTPPLTGTTLLDPLVDFTPDQLQMASQNSRFSVAW